MTSTTDDQHRRVGHHRLPRATGDLAVPAPGPGVDVEAGLSVSGGVPAGRW